MKFYGIADAHGLESFKPVTFNTDTEGFNIDPRELSMMVLRANANRQRHSVVYQAELTAAQGAEVEDMLDNGDYADALIYIKDNAKSISLARGVGAEKSWKLIPNPDLDPFS